MAPPLHTDWFALLYDICQLTNFLKNAFVKLKNADRQSQEKNGRFLTTTRFSLFSGRILVNRRSKNMLK